jgi:MoxR-like ATPase
MNEETVGSQESQSESVSKTTFKYRRRRVVNPDGSVVYTKVREYTNSPRPATPVAVAQTVSVAPHASLVPTPTPTQSVKMKAKGIVKVGKVSLPINAMSNPAYVPQNQYLVGQDTLLEAIAFGISQNMPILLKGETGTGKTTIVNHLGWLTNNSVRQINLNGNTTVDEIVGRTIITEKGTEFLYGILIDCMVNGYWLLLDEINAGLPEVLLALQQVLIDGKYTLVEHNGEVIQAHPNFRIFGTMNPPETYIGTSHLNPATLSRFGITIEVDFPSAELELDIIKSKLPSDKRTPDSEIVESIRLASDIRNGYMQQEYAYMLSTRDLIAWHKVNEHYGNLVESAKYTILGKCNSDDRKAIESILKVYFSAPLSVSVSDGKVGQQYRKGHLFQVCDDTVELQNARNYEVVGKAKSGAVLEVMQVKNGVMIVRVLKGEVVSVPRSADEKPEPVPVSHKDTFKVGDVSKASTRKVDGSK